MEPRRVLNPETKLYRALTSGKCINGDSVTDKAFRLRPKNDRFPAETSLSVALSPDKAMNDLDCKGYTELTFGDIERIEGLRVQPKEGEDVELYEISGIPSDDFGAQTDYALALARIAGKAAKVKMPRR